MIEHDVASGGTPDAKVWDCTAAEVLSGSGETETLANLSRCTRSGRALGFDRYGPTSSTARVLRGLQSALPAPSASAPGSQPHWVGRQRRSGLHH